MLVIFVIRSARPLRDIPHPALVATSLAAVALAVLLPFTALAPALGMVPVPAGLLGALLGVTVIYLLLVF